MAFRGCLWLHQLRSDKAVLKQHEKGTAHSGLRQLAETNDSLQRLLPFGSKDVEDILKSHGKCKHNLNAARSPNSLRTSTVYVPSLLLHTAPLSVGHRREAQLWSLPPF